MSGKAAALLDGFHKKIISFFPVSYPGITEPVHERSGGQCVRNTFIISLDECRQGNADGSGIRTDIIMVASKRIESICIALLRGGPELFDRIIREEEKILSGFYRP